MKIFVFLLLLLSSLTSLAQVSVYLQFSRKQYVANEPIRAQVTITNRAGRDLKLQSQFRGGFAQSWLDFTVRDSRGRDLISQTNEVFQAAVVPAGQSIARKVTLNSLYQMAPVGNYMVRANVQIQGDDVAYTSNLAHATVSQGAEIWRQSFGVPNSASPKREYAVIGFNDGKRLSIYAEVRDKGTGRSLSTFRLSEYLSVTKPQAAIDGKNEMHVLYRANVEVFVHVVVNPDGILKETKYFKRSGGRPPRLVASGREVGVRGAAPFDPTKAATVRRGQRRTSDRPR